VSEPAVPASEHTSVPAREPVPDGLDFIVGYLRSRRPEYGDLAPDFDLIENRVLDSLGLVEFLYLLEEHTGREISLDAVSPEDFRTIARIKERFFQ
jgi:acyl carrier protein